MSILLSKNNNVIDGLKDMLEAVIGPHEYIFSYVDPPIALFIIEIAKRAEDKPEWFPHGKWATIQNIQNMVEIEINSYYKSLNSR